MARILSQVIGHENLIERLLRAAQQNHLPSMFLFVGPAGVGRKKVAVGLAQALVCEKLQIGCGECASCLRIAKNESEALRILAPEKNQIKIEQAHQVNEFLSLRSMSRSRVVIIDEAHLLNGQAANALLKTFEEPPENTYFFLIAPSARHVLPTIRSRSQIVRFGALTAGQLGQVRPAPKWALESALGSFERLDSFLDADEVKLRALAWQILSRWYQNDELLLDPHAREWMKDRRTLLSLTRFWSLAFRDARMVKAGEKERLYNIDQKATLTTLATLVEEDLDQLSRECLELEWGLVANRDVQLCFESFWIRTRRKIEESHVH